jgi:hypothetical protein
MQDLTAKRTLVKSPPELWSELSEVERLARHLGAFGEIKITRLEPERTVAWEGEGASGTVSIEPSGWGTKVTLTAQIEGEEPPPPEPEPEPPAPEPEPPAEPAEPASMGVPEESPDIVDQLPGPPRRRRRWLGRLFGWEPRERAASPEVERPVWVTGAPPPEPPAAPEPEPDPEPEPQPEPEPPVLAEPPAPPAAEPTEADDGAALNRDGAQAALESALEALGSAHHRPFSRG